MTSQFFLRNLNTTRVNTLANFAISTTPSPPNNNDVLLYNSTTRTWAWGPGAGSKGPKGPIGNTGTPPITGSTGATGTAGTAGATGPSLWNRVADVSASQQSLVYNPSFPTLATDNIVAGPNSTESIVNTGGLLAFINNSGETGVGSIRIGISDGTTWQEANRGRASVGLNRRNTASGSLSTAVGIDTIASATGTFAAGNLSKAQGNFSAAIGNDCEVIGGTGNFCTTTQSRLNTGDHMASVGGSQSVLATIQTGTRSFRAAGANMISITGQDSVTLGGVSHTNTGQTAVVGCGDTNIASATGAFVTGDHNTASGQNSVVAGGSFSVASGSNSVIAGSYTSVASGLNSVILCGSQHASNTGAGSNAIVIIGQDGASSNCLCMGVGAIANAAHNDCFIFACGSTTASIAARSFVVRCDGIGRFFSNSALTTGVILNTNSNAWAAISEKRLKENFVDSDGDKLTKSLRDVPIYKFNYVGNDEKRPCYGPMADDWHRAFDETLIGRTNDKVIEGMDMDGVALSIVRDLKRRIDRIKRFRENEIVKTERMAREIAVQS